MLLPELNHEALCFSGVTKPLFSAPYKASVEQQKNGTEEFNCRVHLILGCHKKDPHLPLRKTPTYPQKRQFNFTFFCRHCNWICCFPVCSSACTFTRFKPESKTTTNMRDQAIHLTVVLSVLTYSWLRSLSRKADLGLPQVDNDDNTMDICISQLYFKNRLLKTWHRIELG